jgi:hypothetical protein
VNPEAFTSSVRRRVEKLRTRIPRKALVRLDTLQTQVHVHLVPYHDVASSKEVVVALATVPATNVGIAPGPRNTVVRDDPLLLGFSRGRSRSPTRLVTSSHQLDVVETSCLIRGG